MTAAQETPYGQVCPGRLGRHVGRFGEPSYEQRSATRVGLAASSCQSSGLVFRPCTVWLVTTDPTTNSRECGMSERVAPAVPAGTPSPPPVPGPVEFHYTQTESFVAILHELRASL